MSDTEETMVSKTWVFPALPEFPTQGGEKMVKNAIDMVRGKYWIIKSGVVLQEEVSQKALYQLQCLDS